MMTSNSGIKKGIVIIALIAGLILTGSGIFGFLGIKGFQADYSASIIQLLIGIGGSIGAVCMLLNKPTENK